MTWEIRCEGGDCLFDGRRPSSLPDTFASLPYPVNIIDKHYQLYFLYLAEETKNQFVFYFNFFRVDK